MTTIAAINGRTWCVIAADSQVSYEDQKFIATTNPKIVRNGDYYIAAAGDSRACDIASYIWQPPKPPKPMKDFDKFIVSKVIPSLKKILEQNGYEKTTDSAFQILLAVNGTVTQIVDDYSRLLDQRGLYAIGSGGSVALGALAALAKPFPRNAERASEILNEAVGTACQYSAASSPPIQIVTQTKGGV